MRTSWVSNNTGVLSRISQGHATLNQNVSFGKYSFENLQPFSGNRQWLGNSSSTSKTPSQLTRSYGNLRANNGGYDQKRYNDLVKRFTTAKNQAEKWQLAHQALLNVLPSQRSRTPKRVQAIKNIPPRTLSRYGRVDKTARNWTAEVQKLQNRSNRLKREDIGHSPVNQHASSENHVNQTSIKDKIDFFMKNFPENVSKETRATYTNNLLNSLRQANSQEHKHRILDDYTRAMFSLPTSSEKSQERS